MHRLADTEAFAVDEAVAQSERATGFRNAALCNYLYGLGKLSHEVDEILTLYCRQCAIAMTCQQLAQIGRYLMLDGSPGDRPPVLAVADVRAVNALMLTCGQYEGSGAFACTVGLPCKSGIGGGMLAIAPGIASIGVWSPGLDDHGNSLLGGQAMRHLSEHAGWSVFGTAVPLRSREMALRAAV